MARDFRDKLGDHCVATDVHLFERLALTGVGLRVEYIANPPHQRCHVAIRRQNSPTVSCVEVRKPGTFASVTSRHKW